MEKKLERDMHSETKPEEEKRNNIPVLSRMVSYNIANSVEVLIQKIENEEIYLKPEFQRDFVWDINRASLFVDSLIIGLPIPNIFLGKLKKEEKFIVIDGQQRLKTIYSFLKGKFGATKVFNLHELEGREWDGKTYNDLEPVIQRRFRNAVLNTTIIEEIDTKPDSIHDIFHRLNTGGVPLTDQEVRNCIYAGDFNDLLKELNTDANWRHLFGARAPNKRLYDIELILRFFALFEKLEKYHTPMREFLDEYMSLKTGEKKSQEIASLFTKTVDVINNQLGRAAFKLTNYFNKAIYDSVMVAVARLTGKNRLTDKLKHQHERLLKDKDYILFVSEHTTDEKHVCGRINIATKYFTK